MAILDFLLNGEQLTRVVGTGTLGGSVSPAEVTASSMFSSVFLQGGFESKGDWEISAVNDFWFHCIPNMEQGSSLRAERDFIVFKGNSVELLRFWVEDVNTIKFEYHNGTAWTQIQTDVPWLMAVGDQMDIQINLADTGGYFRLYKNSVLAAELTGDTLLRGESNVDAIQFSNLNSNTTYDVLITEPLIADEDTRDFMCEETRPNAAGNYSQWTGTEPNIDDYLYNASGSAFITTDTAAQRQSFAIEGIDTQFDNGFSVKTVLQAYYAQKASAGGFNVQGMVRISATDYDSATETIQIGSYAFGYIEWANDPSTASPWASTTAIESAEFGFESVA